MLSIDQYKALADLVPAINDELRKKGVSIEKQEVDADDSDEKPAKSIIKAKKDKTAAKKANIEATSDEDEDEDAD